MENYSFKSVAFGGFDKQDVVRYLEQSSEKAAAAQRELEAENETLRQEAAGRAEELDRLRAQVEELTAERDSLRKRLETESAARADLEPLRALEQEARNGTHLSPTRRLTPGFGSGWEPSSARPGSGPTIWKRSPPPRPGGLWRNSGAGTSGW